MARQLQQATQEAGKLRVLLQQADIGPSGALRRHGRGSPEPASGPEPYPVKMEEALRQLGETRAQLADSQQARSDLEDELEKIQIALERERGEKLSFETRLVENSVQLANAKQGYEDLLDEKRRLDASYRQNHRTYLAHKVEMDKFRRWVRSAKQHLILAGLATEDGRMKAVSGPAVAAADDESGPGERGGHDASSTSSPSSWWLPSWLGGNAASSSSCSSSRKPDLTPSMPLSSPPPGYASPP